LFVCSDCYYDGSDSHSSNLTITVTVGGTPDFSLTASPSSITLAQGTPGISIITVTAINGFSAQVSLTVTSPAQLSASISPTSVTGSGTATLTVAGSTPGTYTVQVTGLSGSLAHSVTLTVTVTSTTAGIVCLVQPGSSTCPLSPPAFTGAVGTQLRVAVFIQGSSGLNGFDVTLLADHTVLKPAGIDLTGTVLVGTPTVLVECLSGVLVSGSLCSSVDTVDTIELAATSALGSGITSTPTTGLLFTAIYNITGTTANISISFQKGCANTSVSGGICVTVANGSIMPVTETVMTATFSNAAAAPDFSIAVNPSSLTITAGICGTSTITLTSINGFTGTVTLAATVSPTGPAATLSTSALTLSSGGSATTTLTVCTAPSTPAGSYSVAITGTSGSLSHAKIVSVTVTSPPDFTITATPTTHTIKRGSSATYTMTIKGTNGFNGTIHLTTTISPFVKNGPTITIPSTVGPYSNSTLTISTGHSTPAGTYTITVTATSGSITHSVTITVTVTK
jgi:hypothetical protein